MELLFLFKSFGNMRFGWYVCILGVFGGICSWCEGVVDDKNDIMQAAK
jgi:hypothetical protein